MVEAHVERGTGVLGRIAALARAARRAAPRTARHRRRAPRSRGLRRAVRGPRAVPARGWAVRVLPERGVHGRGVRRARGGVRALAGALREARRRAAPRAAAARRKRRRRAATLLWTPTRARRLCARSRASPPPCSACARSLHRRGGGCGRRRGRASSARRGRGGRGGRARRRRRARAGSFHARADRLSRFGNHDQSGTSPRRKARDAFPPAPVFEFRRARAVQGGFIEEALGTAQGKWRAYVVDPSGARRAVRDGDFLSGAEEEEEEEDSDDPRADSFAGEDANGFFFRNGERQHGQHGHWAMTRGRKPSSVSGGFSETSSQKSARRRPAAPRGRGEPPPFPLRGPRGVVPRAVPRDARRNAYHFSQSRRSRHRHEVARARLRRKGKRKRKRKRAARRVSGGGGDADAPRGARVAARLKRRLKRPTAAPVAALADWPTAENMSEKIGSEASDSEADADIAGGAETPARGLAAAERRRVEFGGGDVGDPVNVAPNADALSDVRDAHATRGLPTAQRGKRSAKPRGSTRRRETAAGEAAPTRRDTSGVGLRVLFVWRASERGRRSPRKPRRRRGARGVGRVRVILTRTARA